MIAKFGNFEFPLAERYRFERELGSGAMGTVYLARDVRLGRAVAIKLLHPMLTNELGIKRFQSEIRIAAGLHHQNIVALHESGEADGRLFYVMDYLGGETLRARLQREKQLPVDDALRITEQVADALQYAHDHGVVHRDVKPENIILAEGRACILDFGLARALGDVDAQRLTASGLAVGTPHYLSPEQAGAEKEVGPAADQYGLACVLYEMLVGEPPFTGPTASAIAMRHITEAPPPLKGRRRSVPDAVDAAVRRAMEKVPADRWARVSNFASATNDDTPTPSPAEIVRRRSLRGAIAGAIALALVALVAGGLVSSDGVAAYRLRSALNAVVWKSLDSTRYAIFPLTADGLTLPSRDADRRLADAFGRWSGVSVPTSSELFEATGEPATSALTIEARERTARKIGARTYVVGTISSNPQLVTVRLELHDAARIQPVQVRSVSIGPASQLSDATFAHLAFISLFGPEAVAWEQGSEGTRNAESFRLYLRARAAMLEWNLAAADSLLSNSLRDDPAFPHAALSLAQVRTWQHGEKAQVAALMTRAQAGAASLSARDRVQRSALSHLVGHDYVPACAEYRDLVSKDSLDFTGWYGLAECNRRDNTVIDDGTNGGRRFRGDFAIAIGAIDRAFELLPRVHPCCSRRTNDILHLYLRYATNSQVRYGRGDKDDTATYTAYAEWKRGVLAFTPAPRGAVVPAIPATHDLAVHQERRLFLAIASRRLSQTPTDPYALEFLGEALELSGDPAAADTMRRARLLTRDADHSLQLASREVWLRVKFGVPDRLADLVRVRALAESLVSSNRSPSRAIAGTLAGLAALTGDADAAARLASQDLAVTEGPESIPRDAQATANSLLAYAAIGGPADSVQSAARRLESIITNEVLKEQQSMVREVYLFRAASIAYPRIASALNGATESNDILLSAERAHQSGNTRGVVERLAAMQRARAAVPPSERTLDALVPEAWLLLAIGDTAGARARLEPTLDALPQTPVSQMNDAVKAGMLMQALELRASLTHSSETTHASGNWARAVIALSDSTKMMGLERIRRAARAIAPLR